MRCKEEIIFGDGIIYCELEKGHSGKCRKTGNAHYLIYEKIPYKLEWKRTVDEKLKKEVSKNPD